MASSPAANAANQDQFIESDSFLKDPHSRLPRYITRRKDLSSNLKVLLGELYGRYCISGNLIFKTSTLADLCGLTIDQTRRAISEGRKKDMFATEPTGRALSYKLIDQKYPRIVNPECGSIHNQSAQKSALSNNIGFNKGLKEKTITPAYEPPPKHEPKTGKKPHEKKAHEGPVVDLKKIKSLVHPVIYNAIGTETMKRHCAGKADKTIKYASDQAMANKLTGKTGLFINTLKDPPQISLSNADKIRTITDDMSEQQRKALRCYNSNMQNGITCKAMKDGHEPTGLCVEYCPYIISIKD